MIQVMVVVGKETPQVVLLQALVALQVTQVVLQVVVQLELQALLQVVIVQVMGRVIKGTDEGKANPLLQNQIKDNLKPGQRLFKQETLQQEDLEIGMHTWKVVVILEVVKGKQIHHHHPNSKT